MIGLAIGVAIGAVAASLISGIGVGSGTSLSEPQPTKHSPNASPAPGGANLKDYLRSNSLTPIPIMLTAPNSAGGVDVWICFRNVSDKPIDYISFALTPYNAVGDVVSSEIGGTSTAVLRFTGPLLRDDSDRAHWENVWYNSTVDHAILESATIEFSDGDVVIASHVPEVGWQRVEGGISPHLEYALSSC